MKDYFKWSNLVHFFRSFELIMAYFRLSKKWNNNKPHYLFTSHSGNAFIFCKHDIFCFRRADSCRLGRFFEHSLYSTAFILYAVPSNQLNKEKKTYSEWDPLMSVFQIGNNKSIFSQFLGRGGLSSTSGLMYDRQ